MGIIRKLDCGTRLGILLSAVAAVAIAAAIQHRIPQPLAYHRFADRRVVFGIGGFFDVISNLPFLYVGVLGMLYVWRGDKNHFADARERWPYFVLFLGTALTCFGSAYYHLLPTNGRLVWDRLPMTVIFTAVLSAAIAERINVKAGLISLGPLIAVGLWSVEQWRLSEMRGAGDLRLYLIIQILPAFAVPLIMALFPPRYTRGNDLGVAFGFYVAAKIFELLDREIYAAGHLLSGHTLKHLAAALAVYWILRMLKRRQVVAMPVPEPVVAVPA